VPVDFLDREVEVTLSDEKPPQPTAFRAGSRQYAIAQRLATWQDNSFAGMKRSRGRRGPEQRTYYRVRTKEGEVYELYADWSPSRRGTGALRWYLHRRLSGTAEEEAEAEAPASAETPPEEPARPQPGE
jgi:hypothetical protein